MAIEELRAKWYSLIFSLIADRYIIEPNRGKNILAFLDKSGTIVL